MTFEQSINWISIYAKEMNKHVCKDLWLQFWEMIYWLYSVLAKKSVVAEYDYEKFSEYLIEKDIVSDEAKKFYPRFKELLKEGCITQEVTLNRKLSFFEKIFSLRNELTLTKKKKKVLRVFGIRICLGTKGKRGQSL